MIYQLRIPGPIEDVEEFRILEWHISEGMAFEVGDLLMEVETQKSIIEVQAAVPGVLRHILCPQNGWQRPGQSLAVVSDALEEEGYAGAPADLPALDVLFEVN